MYYNDSIYVCLTGPTSRYMLHQFKKENDNRTDRIKVRIDLKTSLAPTSSPVYLQMWNGLTNSWETMDSNNTKDADEDFSLYADVTETTYFDFRQTFSEVAVRVYQLNNSGQEKQLCIDLVKISFLNPYVARYSATGNRYRDQYQPTGNKFQDQYSTHERDFEPKYPHKNPQDDVEGV